jgi:hypothetical protein
MLGLKLRYAGGNFFENNTSVARFLQVSLKYAFESGAPAEKERDLVVPLHLYLNWDTP